MYYIERKCNVKNCNFYSFEGREGGEIHLPKKNINIYIKHSEFHSLLLNIFQNLDSKLKHQLRNVIF